MEFLLLFNERKGTTPPEEEGRAAMKKYVGELRRQGVFRRGGPLAPASAGAGVRVRDGKALVTDGPFAETKELVAGFWIIDVADRAAALEIARRCPHAQRGPIELHALRDRYTFTDSENGTPFLLAFRMEPGLGDPDGAKLREMIGFAQAQAREGTVFEIAPLAADPPAGAHRGQGGRDVRDRRPVRGDEGRNRRLQPGAREGACRGDRARHALSARALGAGRGARDPLLRSRVKRLGSSQIACEILERRPGAGLAAAPLAAVSRRRSP